MILFSTAMFDRKLRRQQARKAIHEMTPQHFDPAKHRHQHRSLPLATALRACTLVTAAIVVLIGSLGRPALAETLVRPGDDGSWLPGLASSWRQSDGAVELTLAAKADPQAILSTLRERLSLAKITVHGRVLRITGIPEPALLEQLAHLDLSGESDPLADLSALGDVVAATTSEGGGSIRASKAHQLQAIDVKELGTAEVIEVRRGDFPQVTLVVKMRSSPKAGSMAKHMRRGKRLTGTVIYSTRPDPSSENNVAVNSAANDQNGADNANDRKTATNHKEAATATIDFDDADTQRNLAAYYLRRGDRIIVHVLAPPDAKGGVEFDHVQRRRR